MLRPSCDASSRGGSHDQAISLSEVFQDEVIDKIATKEYVDLVIKREIALLENRISSIQYADHVAGRHRDPSDGNHHLRNGGLGQAALVMTGRFRRSFLRPMALCR